MEQKFLFSVTKGMLASVGGNAWVPVEWEPDIIFNRGRRGQWRESFHVPFIFHLNLQESLNIFLLKLKFCHC